MSWAWLLQSACDAVGGTGGTARLGWLDGNIDCQRTLTAGPPLEATTIGRRDRHCQGCQGRGRGEDGTRPAGGKIADSKCVAAEAAYPEIG